MLIAGSTLRLVEQLAGYARHRSAGLTDQVAIQEKEEEKERQG